MANLNPIYTLEKEKNYYILTCMFQLTDITLELDTLSNYFQFFTSIPHQTNTQTPSASPANIQKPNVIRTTENPSEQYF